MERCDKYSQNINVNYYMRYLLNMELDMGLATEKSTTFRCY